MRKTHIAAVQNGEFELADPQNFTGRKRGYILRIDVSSLFTQYKSLVDQFREIEPDQYFFPKGDLHITVFEFVSARDDYWSYHDRIAILDQIMKNILQNVDEFDIDLVGTIFTRNSGIVAGIDGQKLIELRAKIRTALKELEIVPLERYESKSAHISFMAFKAPLRNSKKLVELIDSSRYIDLETIRISRMELVEQDWYSRNETRKILGEYSLKKIS